MIDKILGRLEEAKYREAQKRWSGQAQRLIQLDYHNELGLSEEKYRTELPSFQLLPHSLPYEVRRRFRTPLLVDPRVSLSRQLQLQGVPVDPLTREATIVSLSFKELEKTHISSNPYLIWVSTGTADESSRTFTQNDRGLTGIEGLALLREHPNLFRFRVFWENSKPYLVDPATGRKTPVLGLERTICADTTEYPKWVMALYKCRYMHEPKAGMKASMVYWDITDRAKHDIIPCTLGDIFEK